MGQRDRGVHRVMLRTDKDDEEYRLKAKYASRRKQDMKKALLKRQRRKDTPAITPPLNELIDRYEDKLMGEQKLTKDTVLRLAVFRGALGHIPIDEITSEDVDVWQKAQYENMSPSTANRNLGVLRTILRYGVTIGWMGTAPKIRMRKVYDVRMSHLELDEIVPVVEWVKNNGSILEGFVLLLLIDTGMRMGEALNLKWGDLEEDWIRVKRKGMAHKFTKTRERMIPTSPRLLKYMKVNGIVPYDDDDFNTLIIKSRWNKTGKYLTSRLNMLIRRAVKELGCRCGEDIRVHDMRHTFAFMCASAGADLADLRDLLGHTTLAMSLRYRGFIKTRAADIIRSATAEARVKDNEFIEEVEGE